MFYLLVDLTILFMIFCFMPHGITYFVLLCSVMLCYVIIHIYTRIYTAHGCLANGQQFSCVFNWISKKREIPPFCCKPLACRTSTSAACFFSSRPLESPPQIVTATDLTATCCVASHVFTRSPFCLRVLGTGTWQSFYRSVLHTLGCC